MKVDAAAQQMLRDQLDAALIGMRGDRFSWWSHWRELADYILPRRYKWLIVPNQSNRGSPINQRMVDNTGTLAMRVCSAGLMSGMTSPGRPWFRLGLSQRPDLEQQHDVRVWLDDVEGVLRRIFAESNFYTSIATMYEDLCTFGTGAMLIDEDYDDVIRCYNAALGEYYLANDERLSVGSFYREYVQRIDQVVEKFGRENCSQATQAAWKGGGAQRRREIVVVHAIEPNKAVNVAGKMTYPVVPKSMPYRDVYWEWGQAERVMLQAKGRNEFPVVAARWDIVGNDPYGRSPGMDALGDIKALQVLQKRKAQAIEKMVNPPLVADVQLKNEPASVIPGGVTYVTGGQNSAGFKPVYEVNPRLAEMVQDIQETQQRIAKTFYNDLFLMISQLDTVRTAAEIDARREEKLIQLGPMLERFENECLDPAIDRTFNIAMRAGILPPIPKALRGQHIKVEYISMLATAQKAAMTAAIERLAGFVGNLAGANPDSLDMVDWDEAVTEYADLLGVSPKVLRAMEQVQQIRQAKQQAMQQQAQAQASMAAVQGAQTLSDTDVGGGVNALQAMLGNTQEAA